MFNVVAQRQRAIPGNGSLKRFCENIKLQGQVLKETSMSNCDLLCTSGLLARSQYSEGPATGHLDTGSSWFLCVYKQMLR